MATTEAELLLLPLLNVSLSGAVGFGLYKLINLKSAIVKPSDYGRKWLAWMVLIVTVSTLPPFFAHFDADSFAKWLIGAVVFGGFAFLLGWAYGIFFGQQTLKNKSALYKNNSQRPKNYSQQILKPICPECGLSDSVLISEIQTLGIGYFIATDKQKFIVKNVLRITCNSCGHKFFVDKFS